MHIKEQEYLKRKYRRYGNNNRMVMFGIYYDEEKGRYIRSYRYTTSSYWKNQVNRKARRANYNSFPRKGNKYRRVFNYWNILY
jgi:hypothetical protein